MWTLLTTMTRRSWACPLLLAAATGCYGAGSGAAASGSGTTEPGAKLHRATARIEPKSGSDLVGTAVFVKEDSRVSLQIDVEHAPPGVHAAHIHAIGDCSSADGKSAGDHWNPAGHDHGKWGVMPFHLGDLGNLLVGEDGKGTLLLTTDLWSIGTGLDNDIVGKAVIVHAGEDDMKTQPTGNAGGRIGCGVIEK